MSSGQPTRSAALEGSVDSAAMAEIKSLVERGDPARARELFGAIVSRHQRRASRIAYQYLRDVADADEAVQDAFVRVFVHAASFNDALPFDVWFTRILINGCLDRRKARSRRDRWLGRAFSLEAEGSRTEPQLHSGGPSPEEALLSAERKTVVTTAIRGLPERQRLVCWLALCGDHTPGEVSELTGLNESTVRVHLFRAIRKLRTVLAGSHVAP